jgi:hypothetical protein
MTSPRRNPAFSILIVAVIGCFWHLAQLCDDLLLVCLLSHVFAEGAAESIAELVPPPLLMKLSKLTSL